MDTMRCARVATRMPSARGKCANAPPHHRLPGSWDNLVRYHPIASISIGLLCSASPGGTLTFTEVTGAAGITAAHTIPVVSDMKPAYAEMAGGGAVGDFNNDGWQDIFFLGGGGVSDQLLINNGNGTFTNQAAAWGVDKVHLGCAANVGDFNGDGMLDIYAVSWGIPAAGLGGFAPGLHILYRNNGDGTFTDIATSAGVNLTSNTPDGYGCAFGDYDNDGDLDLAVGGWFASQDRNRLFRNNGDETFTDVTTTAIPGVNMDTVHGFAPRFVDMDGDGWNELLWAADFVTSKYLKNNADGTFTDLTPTNGTGLDENGMGSTVADFNNDGLLDWYVTNIFSNAPTERFGNRLYMNNGAHSFTESAALNDADNGGWGWGACACDLDLDGWLDIAETNGWRMDTGEYLGENSYIFINDGTGYFTESHAACTFSNVTQGRGLSTLDYDNDGDRDILIFESQGPLRLYRNNYIENNTDRHWLRVFITNDARPDLPPNGMGARVKATVGEQRYLRCIDGGSNYLTNSELSAHFGIASATKVDVLTITWPTGESIVMNDVGANQTITIHPPTLPACDGDVNNDNTVDVNDISYVLFRLGGTTDGDANGDNIVDVNDISYVLFRLASPC